MDPLQQAFDDAELLAWIDDDGEWGGNIYYPPQHLAFLVEGDVDEPEPGPYGPDGHWQPAGYLNVTWFSTFLCETKQGAPFILPLPNLSYKQMIGIALCVLLTNLICMYADLYIIMCSVGWISIIYAVHQA